LEETNRQSKQLAERHTQHPYPETVTIGGNLF